MALNKTQCPHCFTTYVISDEQLRASEGMVRCGTCRERFQARLVTSQQTPRFDPRATFIEPISDEVLARPMHQPEEPEEIEFADSHTESLANIESAYSASLEHSINSELTIEMEDDEFDEQPFDTASLDTELLLANIRAKQSNALGDELTSGSPTDQQGNAAPSPTKNSLNKLELPLRNTNTGNVAPATLDTDPKNGRKEGSKQSSVQTPKENVTPDRLTDDIVSRRDVFDRRTDHQRNSSAIDARVAPTIGENQVSPDTNKVAPINDSEPNNSLEPRQKPEAVADHRIATNEITRPASKSEPINKYRNAPNTTTPSGNAIGRQIIEQANCPSVAKPKRGILRWLFSLFLLLPIVVILSGGLIYQLWYRQLLDLPDQPEVEQLLQSSARPIAQKLAARGISIPVRRNLGQLELVSARTEAHPTRSSTTLLRVSLINHAAIGQPLPWLELSLMNSEGRLVARRQLSPQDYVYNNSTISRVGPKELKKITVELLSFPKQTAGYELKLLNK